MKKFAIIPFVFSAFTAFSQSKSPQFPSIEWSPVYKMPYHHKHFGFLGTKKTGYLQISVDPAKSIVIQKVDSNLRLVGESKKLKISHIASKYKDPKTIAVGKNYYFTFSAEENKKQVLYALKIDWQNGEMIGDPIRVVEGPDKWLDIFDEELLSHRDKVIWRPVLSPDKLKLMLYYLRHNPIKAGPFKLSVPENRESVWLGMVLLDENMKVLWKNEFPFRAGDNFGQKFLDFHVDNNGSGAYIINRPKLGICELFTCKKDFGYIKAQDITIPGKYVGGGNFFEDPKGQLIIGGFYVDDFRTRYNDGLYFLRLNKNTNELSPYKNGAYHFSDSIIDKFYRDGQLRRKVKRDMPEFDEFSMRDIVFNKDGSLEIYAEQLITNVSYGSGGHVYTGPTISTGPGNARFVQYSSTGTASHGAVTFKYDDILAFRLNSDGSFGWDALIKKRQKGPNGPGGLSFKRFTNGNTQHLFFIDTKENLNRSGDKLAHIFVDHEDCYLRSANIDWKGNVSYTTLYNLKENKKVQVTSFKQVAPGELICRAKVTRWKYRVGRIRLS